MSSHRCSLVALAALFLCTAPPAHASGFTIVSESRHAHARHESGVYREWFGQQPYTDTVEQAIDTNGTATANTVSAIVSLRYDPERFIYADTELRNTMEWYGNYTFERGYAEAAYHIVFDIAEPTPCSVWGVRGPSAATFTGPDGPISFIPPNWSLVLQPGRYTVDYSLGTTQSADITGFYLNITPEPALVGPILVAAILLLSRHRRLRPQSCPRK